MSFLVKLRRLGKSKQSEKHPATQEPTAETSISSNQNSATDKSTQNESSKSTASSAKHSTSKKHSKRDKHSAQEKFIFHCQLAHGSPTGLITGFGSVRELYRKIAECFEIPESTILFCTLKTHKVDMAKLLSGHVGLDDFIFVHVKGQRKEIEITKTEESLGLTITDNGADYAFIKRIREGSAIDSFRNLVKIGDHIERINDKSMVGSRHFEVAKALKEIPVGSTFKLRLVEPKPYEMNIELPNRTKKTSNVENGKRTLRFQPNGQAIVEEINDTMVKAIDRINQLLDSYVGINDADLARKIWDLAQDQDNPSDFADAIDESDIGAFNFTDEFIFDLWAAIDDINSGRVHAQNEIESERL